MLKKAVAKVFGLTTSVALGSSIVVVANLAFPSAAHAWFAVCNYSSKTVSVAFAYRNQPDSRDYCDLFGLCEPLPPSQKIWNSEGWWNLASGDCATVYPHELSKRNNYYYVYAESWDGSYWGGNQPFCVINDVFTLAYADDPNRCVEDGKRWVGFDTVYTWDYDNYTYTLTD